MTATGPTPLLGLAATRGRRITATVTSRRAYPGAGEPGYGTEDHGYDRQATSEFGYAAPGRGRRL